MPDTAPPAALGKTQKITVALLALIALLVLFVLPSLVDAPLIESSADSAEPSASTQLAPSAIAEKTRYRQQSQALLADIIQRRDALLKQQVSLWADAQFQQALTWMTRGDEQYALGDYDQSLASFEQAQTAFRELEALAQKTLSNNLDSANKAIEALSQTAAEQASALLSAMAPEQSQVQQLAKRTALLPELIALVDQADALSASGQSDQAEAKLAAASALDPHHQALAQRLATLRQSLADSRFQQHMSNGYAALQGNDFSRAERAFDSAAQLRPQDQAVNSAREQLHSERELAQVNQKLTSAEQQAANENWQQALQTYQALLTRDSSLSEARVRIIAVEVRARLDEQLEKVLADPLQLADADNNQRARTVLADAGSITNPGPRLRNQIEQLSNLLQRATTPVTIQFSSDNQTEVTLFRVARLGHFLQTSLQLKPGNYIAEGIRPGFRDVRIEFSVTGEDNQPPVNIQCTEPI